MADIEYSWYIEPEIETYVGNCLASGDEAVDKAEEEWVRSQLESGNQAAWCVFTVQATRASDGATGSSCIGGCSFRSTQELVDTYFEELEPEALANLHRNHPDVDALVNSYMDVAAHSTNGMSKELTQVQDIIRELVEHNVSDSTIRALLKWREKE